MPLEHSKSKAAVGRNIEREREAKAADGRYVVPGQDGRRKVR